MALHLWLSSPQVIRLGWVLTHLLWQGAVAAGALRVVLYVLASRSSQARYLACTITTALLLLGAGVTFSVVSPPASLDSASLATVSEPMNPQELPLLKHTAGAPILTAAQADSAACPQPVSSMAARFEPAMPWVAGVWVAGVVILSLWNLGGWIAARRLTVLKTRPVPSPIAAIVEKLVRRLQLNKPLRVLTSLLAETPMVIGWLRPVVLIPASLLTGLPREQLEAVLAHELAHVRRHDYLLNLFQIAAETLLFYHPAVWWLSRRIRLEREQCCDDVAVSICGNRWVYVEALAAVEEARLTAMPALSAAGSGRSQLNLRVRRLLGMREGRPRRAPGATITAVLLALGLLVPAALWERSAAQQAGPPLPAHPSATPPASAPSARPVDTRPSSRPESSKSEIAHKTLARACVVLHGGTDFPGYAYVNPEGNNKKILQSRLGIERLRLLNEIAGYESRRDVLLRDLDAGRTPPDIEQRIRDTSTYTQFRNQVISMDLEIKRLEQVLGPDHPQLIEAKQMRKAWQAQVDQEHEELRNALTDGMKAALESEISASKSNLARIEAYIRKAGPETAAPATANVEGRGGFAVFITARPLDDATLSAWSKRLTLYGTMGRPDGMSMFFGPESVTSNLGAPIVVDANDNGQFWRTNLFLIADDVAGWRADDPGYTDKLTAVVNNLKKQIGGDWRIEQRNVDVLSLQPAGATP